MMRPQRRAPINGRTATLHQRNLSLYFAHCYLGLGWVRLSQQYGLSIMRAKEIVWREQNHIDGIPLRR